jgi:hypothetical protein
MKHPVTLSKVVARLRESASKNEYIYPGREVVIGDGDYRQYATVTKIVGDVVFLSVPGYKAIKKFPLAEVSVDLGRRGLVPAKI